MSVTVSPNRPQPMSRIRPDSSQSRKRSPYRTRSHSSEVDETLFGRPARYNDQKDTPRINPEDVTWDPPWVTSPRKTGAPLLWSPYVSKDEAKTTSARENFKSRTPRTPNSPKDKYRIRKLVPSYVDETLFATPRKMHDLKAPWATDEKSPDAAPPQMTWSPPLAVSMPDTPIQSRKIETKSDLEKNTEMHYTPVIKARPGSAINTPQSQNRTRMHRNESVTSKVPQKLNFCIENGTKTAETNEDDPDAIVQRALKLAGVSRKNSSPRYRSNSLDGLSSRPSTPGRYFWRRPPSQASSEAGRTASRLSDRSPDIKAVTGVDDLFSATGIRVPLSARDSPSRPNSARTEKTQDSVPGLDLSRPPRYYGPKRPLSARSARSASSVPSNLSNRPSWRP